MRITVDLNRPRPNALRPRRALVVSAVRFTAFFEDVARASFGTEWPNGTRPPKPAAVRKSLSDLEAQAEIVATDLSFALQSGVVEAEILLDLPVPPRKELTDQEIANLGTAISDMNCRKELLCSDTADTGLYASQTHTAADEPWGTHHLTSYAVHCDFWQSPWREFIDWERSEFYVPAGFIQAVREPANNSLNKRTYPLVAYRPDLQLSEGRSLHGPIVVRDADRALSLMFDLAAVPSPEKIARHRTFKNRLIDEVVAAAWRWLAINVSIQQPVTSGELVEAMRSYLDHQDIDGDLHKLTGKALSHLHVRSYLNAEAETAAARC